jgi:hypothetical protein
MKWYRDACPVCGGDLHDDLDDPGWVACVACARSFAAAEKLAAQARSRVEVLHAWDSSVGAPQPAPE